MRSLFGPLFDRPQRLRALELLRDRIDEALLLADLDRYEGHEQAVRSPGSHAARFARLRDELEALRARAGRLRVDDAETDAERDRLQTELEAIERLTLAAATFKHEILELDRWFFDRSDWLHDRDADATFYSRNRDYTYCDLNRRFVELEQAFWSRRWEPQRAGEPTNDLVRRARSLREDCRKFLEAAPSPDLAAMLRRYLDAGGTIVRETPSYRGHPLCDWLGVAGDALAHWDAAMALPFHGERVRDAYGALELAIASDCTAGLAHAVAFADDAATVAAAWRECVVESSVPTDLVRLYREAASAARWTTAAFVYGLALSCQQREGAGVRWFALAGARR